MADKPKALRCAIYTRKSSEEGLDQDFNSLDAQRAASEAYILSQASEGWELLPARYDDGGYSGGTMDRPGLTALLADIEAGQIDVVVVYKIDRLTRSLTDFSRIVEIFEKADCSFVSVTQSFNTTNSMGRLMLNVLLSFAQFEREVTGERIRDKIAASKKRGMWMGGRPPLGYDLPVKDSRKLEVNEGEAQTVRYIFERYLELGSVHALERELTANGFRSKVHVTRKGKTQGGLPFSRGALFHFLRNRIFLGQIVHKDEVYDGQHDAIIEQDLFDRVQFQLSANARRTRKRSQTRMVKAPLTGKLFDAGGEPMSPTFSRGKSGKSYRYYVSASLQQGALPSGQDSVQRLPASVFERIVRNAVARWLTKPDRGLDQVEKVRLAKDGIVVELCGVDPVAVATRLDEGERALHSDRERSAIHLPLALPLRGGNQSVLHGDRDGTNPDPVLIAALRKAHSMLSQENGLPTMDAGPVSRYDANILRLAFLAPDIQQDILEGRQPASLNVQTFRSVDLPLAWFQQRGALGYDDAR
jgi:DNA invertase Pin-like site-specific DNA recombinase